MLVHISLHAWNTCDVCYNVEFYDRVISIMIALGQTEYWELGEECESAFETETELTEVKPKNHRDLHSYFPVECEESCTVKAIDI